MSAVGEERGDGEALAEAGDAPGEGDALAPTATVVPASGKATAAGVSPGEEVLAMGDAPAEGEALILTAGNDAKGKKPLRGASALAARDKSAHSVGSSGTSMLSRVRAAGVVLEPCATGTGAISTLSSSLSSCKVSASTRAAPSFTVLGLRASPLPTETRSMRMGLLSLLSTRSL